MGFADDRASRRCIALAVSPSRFMIDCYGANAAISLEFILDMALERASNRSKLKNIPNATDLDLQNCIRAALIGKYD